MSGSNAVDLSETVNGGNVFGEPRRLRVAIVHDWLYTYGGAERVLRSMLRCLPTADVFTLFDVLSNEDRAQIGFEKANTSFMQKLPGISRRHRLYLPLMPLAIEQFDLSSYDMVISSSYAVAKGVLTGPDQLHLSYVYSPMRYAWDLQHQYLAESGITRGVKSAAARLLLHRMRIWDSRTAHGVNSYIASSNFIARRVEKAYGRTSRVIYPPVRVPSIPPLPRERGQFFLTASRLVPYKNIRVIIEAFRDLPNERLVVAGEGPEYERLVAVAQKNVTFVGFVPDKELRRLMRSARAFVFAAEEDFGIVPLEAQAEGTPVIALGRGGARETIITGGSAPTGLFFGSPDPAEIAAALRVFIAKEPEFKPSACHKNAVRFSEARFEAEFSAFVVQQLSSFRSKLECGSRSYVDDVETELVAAE